jgi:hypothetical protein
MALDPKAVSATSMIRTLEGRNPNEGRDHFFHSFQNYFLGVPIVSQCAALFDVVSSGVRLDWNIDAQMVWFLTAMWHDVGYAIQKYHTIYGDSYGLDSGDDSEDHTFSQFMARPSVKEAIRVISSLLVRFLRPENVKTGWISPSMDMAISPDERKIQDAMHLNCQKSHGALGAIRLFCDFFEGLKAKDYQSDQVRQTVLLACCSMPFHDWYFRDNMRRCFGECVISSDRMPFAALLAFVDSIQDDRRELVGPLPARRILDDLSVDDVGTVSAALNADQYDPAELLEKMLEARDVRASFLDTDGVISFKYPDWMG